MNPRDKGRLKIFLSSPGDVEIERSMARRVITRLTKDPLWNRYVELEIASWDDPDAPALMQATLTPQEAVNLGSPKPSECDIAMFILWSRLGTPLDPQRHGYKRDGTPFRSGTEWEFFDALGAAERTRRPLILLYRRTDRVLEANEQSSQVNEFFASLACLEGYRRGVNNYEKPLDFWCLFDSHLKQAIEQLVTIEPDEKSGSWQQSPYPGLRSFSPEEAEVFFGREQETGFVVSLLEQRRFAVVVGPSGSGKSSLAKAGVVAQLRKATDSQSWEYFASTPGGAGNGNPFDAIYESVMDRIPSLRPAPLEAPRAKQAFCSDLLARPEGLTDIITAALRDRPGGGGFLLLIDQFEELFTHVGERYRAAFVNMLASVASCPLSHTLLTLRADFYEHLANWPALVELANQGQYLLRAPGAVAIGQMITLPAERAGLRLEEGLADRILDDAGRQPGSLPLMASVLRQLYDRRTDGLLTNASYEALGGVNGAIQRQAREAEQRLAPEQRALLPELFESLVTLNENGVATRRTVHASKFLDSREDLQELVAVLTEQRLLVTNAVGNRMTLEVAHEALLHNWTSLAAWIERVSRTRKLNWDFPRSSGVLLPVACLPGPYGIGEIGESADRFVDWLHAAAQTWWHIVPFGPTASGQSPYHQQSSFAGNDLLISLDDLARRGWLSKEDFATAPTFLEERINYELVSKYHTAMLDLALENFCKQASDSERAEFAAFSDEARFWLEDYALFAAAKEKMPNTRWTEWPEGLAHPDRSTLAQLKREWSHDLDRHRFRQWVFRSQWTRLKRHANRQGVRIMGDLPALVSFDSPDVWSHQSEFLLDAQGRPAAWAGTPPDHWSATGSNWGLPLYRWEVMEALGLTWWKERLRLAFQLFDSVRVITFSSLFKYWEVPSAAKSAAEGRWGEGPGKRFFEAMRAEFGHLPLVAEDLQLNFIAREEGNAVDVRDAYRIPGVKILQFGFDMGDFYNSFKPHWFGNNIVYTGTPDTSTLLGWWQGIDDSVKAVVETYMGPVRDPPRDLIRLAMMSAAHTVILPLQDVLGRGDEARLDAHGGKNSWTWRVDQKALTDELTSALRHMTFLFDRAPSTGTDNSSPLPQGGQQ